MRTFFTLAASLLATSTTVLAQTPSEGFIGKTRSTGNHTDTKEFIITFMKNETIPDSLEGIFYGRPELQSINKDSLMYVSDGSNNGTRFAIVKLCEEDVDKVRGFTEVNIVEQKAVIKSFAQKTGSPWGLQRISNEAGASGSPQGQDFTYSFEDESLGWQ